MNSSDVEHELLSLAAHVQGLVNFEFGRVGGQPEPGTALAQAGLQDGLATVTDYVQHNEPGAALHHLLYMVTETEVELAEPYQTRLAKLARRLDHD